MKKKLFIMAFCLVAVLSLLIGLKTSSVLTGFIAAAFMIVFGTLFLCLFLLLNKRIRKTNWYKSLFVDGSVYPDNYWYREHDERNFDIVTLGSTSAKYAYDFSFADGIKGMNWAQAPQTLVYDFKLLQNFHSILRKGGVCVINIMPFTSLNKKCGVQDYFKYVNVLAPELLDGNVRLYNVYKRYPVLYKPKTALKRLIRDTPPPKNMDEITLAPEEMKANAESFVCGWKKQFGIDDFEASLTEQNKEGREFRKKLLCQMIEFCKEREIVPVIVVLPTTNCMKEFLTKKFKEIYIDSFLNEVKNLHPDVICLDYMNDEAFCDNSLYFNSICMNKNGRRLLTGRLISDLRKLKLC